MRARRDLAAKRHEENRAAARVQAVARGRNARKELVTLHAISEAPASTPAAQPESAERAAPESVAPAAAAPSTAAAHTRPKSGSVVGQIFSAELGGDPAPHVPPVNLPPSNKSSAEAVTSASDSVPAAGAEQLTPRKSGGSFLGRLSLGMGRSRGSATRARAATDAVQPAQPPVTTRPRRITSLMKDKWDAKVHEAEEQQRHDPFSRKFDGGTKLKKGDAGYGTAVAGSATAERAQKAQAWVDTEIDKLLDVIRQHGHNGPTGATAIEFGQLFNLYADISDTLVGILMRARKRGRLSFESAMLFQGVHDHVLISIVG